MAEEKPEKGTQQNPLTREDVLQAIEENGGTANELDLSGKWFEEGINLSGLVLNGIILTKAHLFGANLAQSNLQFSKLGQTNLTHANLQKTDLAVANLGQANLGFASLQESILIGANLEQADLQSASLDKADLSLANLRRANLADAEWSSSTRLDDIDWGNYVLGDEQIADSERKAHLYSLAEGTYRRLKQWYTSAGMYDVAGKFFFREMTVKRKLLRWWPNPFPRLWSKFVSIICGYGEKPERVAGWAASWIAGLAIVYFLVGGVWQWAALWRSLYFSAVSFTALGYGSWMKATSDWMIGLGAAESFLGVFSMALFLVTFTRKMTR